MAQRRGLRAVAWVVVSVVALVAVLFGADSVLRSYAQSRMKSEIVAALPDGVTVPGLRVSVGGFSFLVQYLRGDFERVDVEAPQIDTARGSVAADLVARNVRIDRSFAKPPVLGKVTGELHVTESAVNSLVALPDPTASIQLRSKTVSYLATTQVLGVPLSYSATVRPLADGDVVRLFPQSVSVTSGHVDFNVKQLIGGLFNGKPINVCIAPYLPSGLYVGDITVGSKDATIDFRATDFSLAEKTFSTHGSCPSS